MKSLYQSLNLSSLKTDLAREYTVSKQNPAGEETWRYKGQLLTEDEHSIVLEAYFDRDDTVYHGMRLARGDRFIEFYYTDRWYNIYEIYAVEDGHLRGWYCNIATPAMITPDRVEYQDLALDLLVFPDGRQLVLDEDEFAELAIPPEMCQTARITLEELQGWFRRL